MDRKEYVKKLLKDLQVNTTTATITTNKELATHCCSEMERIEKEILEIVEGSPITTLDKIIEKQKETGESK